MAIACACEETKKDNANCTLENNLQQASTSSTQSDKALVYDTNRSADVHLFKNCYDNDIFNMFTQEEQYTKLLEPIPKPHQVPQNDSNAISEVSSIEQGGRTVEQHSVNVEETRADELLDKQIQLENKIKELDNILVKTGQSIQTMHMLSPKPDSFYHTEQKIALGYQNLFYLKQAQQKQLSLYNGKVLLVKHNPPSVHDSEETLELAQETAKFVRDFKSLAKEADESLSKHKALELEIERLLRAVDTTHGTCTNTKFAKQQIIKKLPSSRPKLYDVYPLPKSKAILKIDESHALSKPVTSNSVPTLTESKVVKNDHVISPEIFRINPFKGFRVDNFVPNKHVKPSVRAKSITVSQPHVITKNDVNSKQMVSLLNTLKALLGTEDHCLRTILRMIRSLLSLKVVGSRIT
nr:Gag-Pol polyprotein [Tanacetum cinerariifolium]